MRLDHYYRQEHLFADVVGADNVASTPSVKAEPNLFSACNMVGPVHIPTPPHPEIEVFLTCLLKPHRTPIFLLILVSLNETLSSIKGALFGPLSRVTGLVLV